uniref:Uncharacterized protein n=1 Tax=Cucumis melo TaxID=3656 RepID=A0A9I9E3T2_CUCME
METERRRDMVAETKAEERKRPERCGGVGRVETERRSERMVAAAVRFRRRRRRRWRR